MTTSNESLEIPCLGRSMELGMLYDCRKEQVIAAVTLWDRSVIDEHADTIERRTSDFEVITDETFEKKAATFDVKSEMKLSLLSGLVSVDGSAKYLNDNKTSVSHARVSLKYSSKTFFQQLSMKHMAQQNIQYKEVFEKGIATHVITGIQYGADAVFVFERQVEEKELCKKVEGSLKAAVEKIPKVNVGVDGRLDINDEDRCRTEHFKCIFHGDICLESNPTTFEEAIAIYKDLPALIKATAKTEGGVYGVPKKAFLYPLTKLNDRAAKLKRQISVDTVADVEKMLENYSLLQMSARDLEAYKICEKIPGIQKQLSTFREIMSRHVQNFQQNMIRTLPKIRSGRKDEKVLTEYLSEIGKSQFSRDTLEGWIDSKKTELSCLEGYFNLLTDFKVASESGQLERFTHDGRIRYVVVLHFGSAAKKSDPYLTLLTNSLTILQNFLTPPALAFFTRANSSIRSRKRLTGNPQWFTDKTITRKVLVAIRQFRSFAEANKTDQNLEYVVSTCSTQDDSMETPGTIFLYENARRTPFEPPSITGTPNSTYTAEHEIKLAWDKPENGAESVIHYTIRYHQVSQGVDTSCEINTNDNQPQCHISDLKPNTLYKFQVAATCQIGIGGFSDWSRPIKTTALPSLAANIHQTCDTLNPGSNSPITWYQLPMKEVHPQRFEIFQPIEGHRNRKVILMVGAKSSGKTSLINGMVNYILGVSSTDRFRFQLIPDSHTAAIATYTVHWQLRSQVHFTVTVIDTPGFDDSRGNEQNFQITDQIRQLFQDKGDGAIGQLDAICVVAPASETRLIDTHKYVFESLLSIFGKDVAGIIFVMLTFADDSVPPVLTALDKVKLPRQKHFKFNNTVFALASSNAGSEFGALYWRLSAAGFSGFFDQLTKVDTSTSLAHVRAGGGGNQTWKCVVS